MCCRLRHGGPIVRTKRFVRTMRIRFGPTADDEMCMLLGTWWVANPGEEMDVQHRYKWEE